MNLVNLVFEKPIVSMPNLPDQLLNLCRSGAWKDSWKSKIVSRHHLWPSFFFLFACRWSYHAHCSSHRHLVCHSDNLVHKVSVVASCVKIATTSRSACCVAITILKSIVICRLRFLERPLAERPVVLCDIPIPSVCPSLWLTVATALDRLKQSQCRWRTPIF